MKKILTVAAIIIAVATLCWPLKFKAEKKEAALPIDTPHLICQGNAGLPQY